MNRRNVSEICEIRIKSHPEIGDKSFNIAKLNCKLLLHDPFTVAVTFMPVIRANKEGLMQFIFAILYLNYMHRLSGLYRNSYNFNSRCRDALFLL